MACFTIVQLLYKIEKYDKMAKRPFYDFYNIGAMWRQYYRKVVKS